MKQVNEQPTEGHFVAIWEYQGAVWSGTYRYNSEGELESYLSGNVDEWQSAMMPTAGPHSYFVL